VAAPFLRKTDNFFRYLCVALRRYGWIAEMNFYFVKIPFAREQIISAAIRGGGRFLRKRKFRPSHWCRRFTAYGWMLKEIFHFVKIPLQAEQNYLGPIRGGGRFHTITDNFLPSICAVALRRMVG
jgi:hypothetical protein